jgi:hypothetical protein
MEVGMRKSAQAGPWAVYEMTLQGQPGPKVVCFQHEWEAIEKATPGIHRLIKDEILNEGEAERLARGTSGDDRVRARKKLIAELLAAEPDFIVESRGEAGNEKGQDDAGLILLPFPTLANETAGLDAADEPPARFGTAPNGKLA